MFQHTAARRRLGLLKSRKTGQYEVSTHSRPKAAGVPSVLGLSAKAVSTHSRPKAAGGVLYGQVYIGGQFQHTAARRRLAFLSFQLSLVATVSTHSRPKAAGRRFAKTAYFALVSTHSRPKAAGYKLVHALTAEASFNTQPPEGGWGIKSVVQNLK